MLLVTGINTSRLLPTWQQIDSPFVVTLFPIDNENLSLPCVLEGNCCKALRSPADLHHERPRWCDWPRCPRPSGSLIHQSTTSKVWKPKEGGPFKAKMGEMPILMTWQQRDWGSWSLPHLESFIKIILDFTEKNRFQATQSANLTANLALKADNLEENTDKFDVANLLHPRLNLSYSGDHHGQRRCEAVGETSHRRADHVLLTYSTSGPWCLGRIQTPSQDAARFRL